jgi:multidrug efflux system membrane fusion protein
LTGALTLSAAVALAGLLACDKHEGGGGGPPDAGAARPVAVSVTAAVRRDVPIYLDGLGSVTAWKTVTVRPLVDGRLDKVRFQEGQQVRKGEVLAEIDPRPFLAQLHQAEGAMARDTALLRNNRVNLERYTKLAKDSLIPQQQADDQKAAVEQYSGAVTLDQGQIEDAKLKLTYAQVTSPIDGVTGVRLIDEGNIVHAADPGGLVMVTQLDPIAVLFTLPEDDLPKVLERQQKGTLKVEAYSREGDKQLGVGDLIVVDNQINQSTATVRLKARFDNPDRKLWPNQFVKARLLLDVRKDAIVVPAVAVQRGPKGSFVYVVQPDQTAAPRPVEVDLVSGAEAVLTRGIDAGATVVIEGQNQLKPGALVSISGSRKGGDGKGDGGKGDGSKGDGGGKGHGGRRGDGGGGPGGPIAREAGDGAGAGAGVHKGPQGGSQL